MKAENRLAVDELKRKRFLWGVALAWTPWIPTLIGLGYALICVWGQKATGIGVVAGGVAELFVLWGIIAIFIGQTPPSPYCFGHFRQDMGYVVCSPCCPSA